MHDVHDAKLSCFQYLISIIASNNPLEFYQLAPISSPPTPGYYFLCTLFDSYGIKFNIVELIDQFEHRCEGDISSSVDVSRLVSGGKVFHRPSSSLGIYTHKLGSIIDGSNTLDLEKSCGFFREAPRFSRLASRTLPSRRICTLMQSSSAAIPVHSSHFPPIRQDARSWLENNSVFNHYFIILRGRDLRCLNDRFVSARWLLPHREGRYTVRPEQSQPIMYRAANTHLCVCHHHHHPHCVQHSSSKIGKHRCNPRPFPPSLRIQSVRAWHFHIERFRWDS